MECCVVGRRADTVIVALSHVLWVGELIQCLMYGVMCCG